MALRDQPYFKMYAKDFSSDERLRNCSAESVGVYIMTMCFLHRTPKYGALTLEERQKISSNNIENFAKVLLRQLPFTFEEIMRGLTQLVTEGVLTVDGDTLYQKRMVKDGELSETRAVAGASGGLAKKNGKQNDSKHESKSHSKTQSKKQAKENANGEQNPEPGPGPEYVSESYVKDTEDNELGKVMSYYMDKLNPTPSSLIVESLRGYTDALSADVIIHAINIALDERKYAWSYLNAILDRYTKEGLTTMDKLSQSEQAFKSSRKRGGTGQKTKAPSEYKGGDFIAEMMEAANDS